jgi:hypothetical protein
MVDWTKEIATLRLFNEKADKLEQSRFLRILIDERSGVQFEWSEEGGDYAQRYGPDQEAIDAVALTYRFFVMSNEATSLRMMGRLYATLPIDPALVQQFTKTRDAINALLDSRPYGMAITYNGERLTERMIIETFFYGGLVHANDAATVARFRSWRAAPPFFALVESLFVDAIAKVILGILHIRGINQQVIAALEWQQGGGAG